MAESFSNSLISNTIFYLLNFERYPSFPAALREAAVNNNFQVCLFTEEFNRIFAVETRHLASVDRVLKAKMDQNIVNNSKSITSAETDLVTFWKVISIAGEKYNLLLVDNDGDFSEDDLSKLSEIIELAMGMWNYKPERDVVAEFVSALRRGNRSLAHILCDELPETKGKFGGVYYIPRVDKDSGLKLLLDFESDCGIKSLKQVDSTEIAGVIIKGESGKTFTIDDWNRLAEKLRKAGAGISFCYLGAEDIDSMCAAFKTINSTEKFVPLIFPMKVSFTKYEMALAHNCVNLCTSANSTLIKNDYQQLLKPLSESEDPKMRQLMDTLETFILDAGTSTTVTSKMMKIHANTVQYRLKHIRELLNVDITDNTVIPGLTMALALRRIDKEVRSI